MRMWNTLNTKRVDKVQSLYKMLEQWHRHNAHTNLQLVSTRLRVRQGLRGILDSTSKDLYEHTYDRNTHTQLFDLYICLSWFVFSLSDDAQLVFLEVAMNDCDVRTHFIEAVRSV